ncbi:hypothetical protein ACHAQH_004683 [Verticillium albo-atrum]
MASWFERGRPALLEALTTACNQIDTDLRAELEEEERRRQNGLEQELQVLRRRAAVVDRLEAENRNLQTSLLRYQAESRAPDIARDNISRTTIAETTPTPRSESPSSTLETPSKQHIESLDTRKSLLVKTHQLKKKFHALDSNYRRLMSAYNKKKDELTRRDEQVIHLEAKVEALQRLTARAPIAAHAEDGADHTPSFERSRFTRASSHVPPSAPPIDATASVSFSSDPGLDAGSREPSVAATIPPMSCPTSSRKTSTTGEVGLKSVLVDTEVELPPLPRHADPVMMFNIKPEPSSDGPLLLMERAVPKRKGVDDTEELPCRRIKAEFSRSSSIAEPCQNPLLYHDSLDLDEVGQKLSTPRKNRLIADALKQVSGPSAGQAALSNAVIVLQDDDPRLTSAAVEPSALTPINPNARIMRPLATKSVDRAHKRGLAQGIGSLAEDGNLYQRAVRKQASRDPLQTPLGGSRLNRLLNTSGTGEKPAVVRSAPRPLRPGADATLATFGAPGRRELPFGKEFRGRSVQGNKAKATATATTRHQVDEHEDESPQQQIRQSLRATKALSLRLEDFKINPEFNNGQSFAFSEVVRSKDDRSCLPGCTDMSCCGKQFRGLAMAQRGNRNDAEDMKLFEKYLGDSISRIWGMSKVEKEELWLEAKIWELAEQMGKHRHRYARRPSPPGFWNTEFPSTQEVEAEKAEAEKRDRQMVADRYREAMRPGGRWVFRDE